MRLRILFSILFFYGVTASEIRAQYLTAPNGLKYFFWRQYSNASTPKPKVGDYVYAYILGKTETDTFLNSWEDNKPEGLYVIEPTYKGCINEAFTLMSERDSAQFRVVADSFYKYTKNEPMPANVRKGSYITFIIKLKAFVPKDQITAYYQNLKYIADSVYKRDVGIYLAKKNLDTLMTPSGLIYSFSQQNIKGRKIKLGDKVGLHWEGYLIDGTKFGSSVDGYVPATINVGKGEVVAGLDEMLQRMHEGDVVRVIIPYSLGFGGVEVPYQFQGQDGNIPPYSTLIYDLQIIEILNK